MRGLRDRALEALTAAAEPGRAAGMQAYMKSEMPFLGVSARPLRTACRSVFAELAYDDAQAWQDDVLSIWRGARFREERYAAIELTGIRAARRFQDLSALPMYEEMIVNGAWWDYVDTLATHRLWAILRHDRAAMTKAMLGWSRDGDMWKRRSAILCQIPAKGNTDLSLLYACIEPSLGSREFFLRKAIGWALRQYAWTDPHEIARYVAAHDDQLSGLSRREALKNMAKLRPD